MSRFEADLHSDSPVATQRYGAALGSVLRRGDVLVLDGPLGAGKTCLVRGIVAGAGGDAATVRSPTFVLHQPHRGATITVHHIDLYRLGPAASIDVLDLDSALEDGAAVIEWGGHADLADFDSFTVTIAGGDASTNRRVLRLVTPAPAHITDVWRKLQQDAAR
jgi:tRNA threonylcarbamoyladenosine biosynthesis protein TsaE